MHVNVGEACGSHLPDSFQNTICLLPTTHLLLLFEVDEVSQDGSETHKDDPWSVTHLLVFLTSCPVPCEACMPGQGVQWRMGCGRSDRTSEAGQVFPASLRYLSRESSQSQSKTF